MAAKKKKASKKQLANLAKGRAKLKAKRYGVTKEFSRRELHEPHMAIRRSCKHCKGFHTTSQHNAHAYYGATRVLPAYKLTHKNVRGHATAKKTSIVKTIRAALGKNYR